MFTQNIENVEYFSDTDPGYGNATEIAITSANLLDLDFLMLVDELDFGFIEFGNLVRIYPNPSTGKLYIEIVMVIYRIIL